MTTNAIRSTVKCDDCPQGQELTAEFMVTQIGKRRVLIKACPTHVTHRMEQKEKVTFTLLTALWFFQDLASIHRPEQVKLKIRKDGEKKLCSRPDCDGDVHGKTVTVYGVVYPICSCCSVAAYVAANKWDGPWPQDEEKAVEDREETNDEARAKLLRKLGLGPKGQLVTPLAVLTGVTAPPKAEANPRQPEGTPSRPNGKKGRKAAAKKFQSPGSVARHLLKCKGVITARMYWFGKLADKPRSAAPTATQPEAASVAY